LVKATALEQRPQVVVGVGLIGDAPLGDARGSRIDDQVAGGGGVGLLIPEVFGEADVGAVAEEGTIGSVPVVLEVTGGADGIVLLWLDDQQAARNEGGRCPGEDRRNRLGGKDIEFAKDEEDGVVPLAKAGLAHVFAGKLAGQLALIGDL